MLIVMTALQRMVNGTTGDLKSELPALMASFPIIASGQAFSRLLRESERLKNELAMGQVWARSANDQTCICS